MEQTQGNSIWSDDKEGNKEKEKTRIQGLVGQPMLKEKKRGAKKLQDLEER